MWRVDVRCHVSPHGCATTLRHDVRTKTSSLRGDSGMATLISFISVCVARQTMACCRLKTTHSVGYMTGPGEDAKDAARVFYAAAARATQRLAIWVGGFGIKLGL